MKSYRSRAIALALACIGPLADRADAQTPMPVTRPATGPRLHFRGKEIFLSGANLAWFEYGRDFGAQDAADRKAFAAFFADLRANGGNCARIWVHTEGADSPQWDAQGRVAGLSDRFLDDMGAVLDSAKAHGILVLYSLWSERLKNEHHELVTDTAKTRTYIEKALAPMARRFRGHPALLAWEVLNEPEGMTPAWGWKDANAKTDWRIPVPEIQRFINRLAGAVHRLAPGQLVTAGSWGFFGSTDIALSGEGANWWPGPNQNLYSDARLIAAGGDSLGTLDFYQVHHYDQSFPEIISPFSHPVGHWKLDKPVLIGEFPAFGLRYREPKLSITQAFEAAYQGGYAGALVWQYNTHDSAYTGWWGQARAGAKALRDAHPDRIDPAAFPEVPTTIRARAPEWRVIGGAQSVRIKGKLWRRPGDGRAVGAGGAQ